MHYSLSIQIYSTTSPISVSFIVVNVLEGFFTDIPLTLEWVYFFLKYPHWQMICLFSDDNVLEGKLLLISFLHLEGLIQCDYHLLRCSEPYNTTSIIFVQMTSKMLSCSSNSFPDLYILLVLSFSDLILICRTGISVCYASILLPEVLMLSGF